MLAGNVSSLVWIVLLLAVLSCDVLAVPLIFVHMAPPTVKTGNLFSQILTRTFR